MVLGLDPEGIASVPRGLPSGKQAIIQFIIDHLEATENYGFIGDASARRQDTDSRMFPIRFRSGKLDNCDEGLYAPSRPTEAPMHVVAPEEERNR
jgi:hypothetical protein